MGAARRPSPRPPARPRAVSGVGRLGLTVGGVEVDRLYERCTLTGSAPAVDWRQVDLADCVLASVALPGGELTACSWVDVEAATCDLQGLTSDRFRWLRVAVSGCRLSGATFTAADLRDTTVEDVRAPELAIRSSRLLRAAFTDSSLTDLDLGDSELTEVAFVRCDLTGARFRGTRMSAVTFIDCDLSAVSGATGLAGASIDGPTLQTAAVSLARGLGIEVG